MKHMKKLLSLVLTLVTVFALSATAMAVDITITNGATDSEYSAYKLLNATNATDDTKKFAYTVNSTYFDVLKEVTGKTTGADIVDYISKLNEAEIRTFADTVYGKVKTKTPDYVSNNPDADNDAVNVFEGVDQGYYLIVETATGSVTGPNGTFEEDTFSLVMLDTAGNEDITVKTKEELPESEKKVKDINDSTETEMSKWQDSADHDIGDDVPFQITFTLPADFAAYETYYVGIHDVQAPGLIYNNDLVVSVNDTILGGFTYSAVAANACAEKCTFHIQCADIIAAATDKGITLKAGDKIVFNYTAKLTGEGVVLGAAGNPNKMRVEFSNNPYGTGTSKTPWDKVIVFTYKVNVDKYAEEVKEGNELSGADFTLYKEVPAGTAGAQTGAVIKATFASNVKAAKLDDAKSYIVVSNKTTDAARDTFDFKGVDDGNYVLVETTIPDGYNAWESVAFTISASHETEDADPQLISLAGGDLFTGDVATGVLDADIENKSGLELPETGGIGTTIFYVLGGVMMAGAVVLMVTKRRMNAER